MRPAKKNHPFESLMKSDEEFEENLRLQAGRMDEEVIAELSDLVARGCIDADDMVALANTAKYQDDPAAVLLDMCNDRLMVPRHFLLRRMIRRLWQESPDERTLLERLMRGGLGFLDPGLAKEHVNVWVAYCREQNK